MNSKIEINVHSDSESSGLYVKESKVYPRDVEGRYASLRKAAMIVLLGLFYLIPWLTWDGRQAVLFDLPARKFHVFGLTLWPQDFVYLAALLILAALTLFFFTALAGRLWCGYACPQTVWTEAFLLMERWVEGDRNRRIKLDQAPWTFAKLRRKAAKQSLWILFSLWTGFTFVAYFTPARQFAVDFAQLNLHGWTWFWMLFYGFATYGNAGFLREQVCKYMCPYARFQSAMFDRDSLIISYDEKRGEPRGGRRRGADLGELNLGSCVNCTLCVQVCPTGIDIREGLQYECIACAACIDACDTIMDKMDYPRGLIRYTTERELSQEPTRILRPRILVYGSLLITIIAVMTVSLIQRVPLRVEIMHDRNALFRVLDRGIIENVYSMRVINMSDQDREYDLSVEKLDGANVEIPLLRVEAGSSASFPIRIQASEDVGRGGQDIAIKIVAATNPEIQVTRSARFFLPVGP